MACCTMPIQAFYSTLVHFYLVMPFGFFVLWNTVCTLAQKSLGNAALKNSIIGINLPLNLESSKPTQLANIQLQDDVTPISSSWSPMSTERSVRLDGYVKKRSKKEGYKMKISQENVFNESFVALCTSDYIKIHLRSTARMATYSHI